jgi:hypothetical protein
MSVAFFGQCGLLSALGAPTVLPTWVTTCSTVFCDEEQQTSSGKPGSSVVSTGCGEGRTAAAETSEVVSCTKGRCRAEFDRSVSASPSESPINHQPHHRCPPGLTPHHRLPPGPHTPHLQDPQTHFPHDFCLIVDDSNPFHGLECLINEWVSLEWRC